VDDDDDSMLENYVELLIFLTLDLYVNVTAMTQGTRLQTIFLHASGKATIWDRVNGTSANRSIRLPLLAQP